jgi:hypothetical protein
VHADAHGDPNEDADSGNPDANANRDPDANTSAPDSYARTLYAPDVRGEGRHVLQHGGWELSGRILGNRGGF